MSQISKLLRHAADTSLIPTDSIKLPAITRPNVNHISPNPSAKINNSNKSIQTRRTNMVDSNEKSEKELPVQEPGIPKPVTIHKQPSWIDLENCRNDNCFRQALASPEHKEAFEGSMIPLPSPDEGAKRGQIYSPTRMSRAASSTLGQSSASQGSNTPAWSRETGIGQKTEYKKEEEGEYGFRELDTKSEPPGKPTWVDFRENNTGREPPKRVTRQQIREEANAEFVLTMSLRELEEKLRDGVLEREMDEHSEERLRAYELADGE